MVCTKNSSLIIAPGLDQDNAAFEKMVSSNKLVNLKNKQHQRSRVFFSKITLQSNSIDAWRERGERVVSHTTKARLGGECKK
jgi:hypothetical protein